MKTYTKIIALGVLALAALSACKSAPDFKNVAGKEWKLSEIRTEPPTTFNRDDLKNEGFGDIFTLSFDGERLSGVGAPNRYAAPYKLGDDQTITVQPIAGTLMAPLREPEKLKERRYFNFLQSAYKWNITKTQFELYTKDENDAEAVLIYTR